VAVKIGDVITHEEFLSGNIAGRRETEDAPGIISHEEFMGLGRGTRGDAPEEFKFRPAYHRALDVAHRIAHVAFPNLLFNLETPQTRQDKLTVMSGAIGSVGAMAAGPAWAEAVVGIDTPIGRYSQRVSDFINGIATDFAPDDPDFFDAVLSGAGSSVTFLVPGKGVQFALQGIPKTATMLTKMAPAIGVGIMTVIESSAEAGGVFNEMRARGHSPDESGKAALKTFIANLGLVGITNHFGIGSTEVDVFKKFILSAPLEAFQEFGQSIIEDLAKGDEIDWNQAAQAAGVGAIVGGGMGAGVAIIESQARPRMEQILDQFPGVEMDAATQAELAKVTEVAEPTAEVAPEAEARPTVPTDPIEVLQQAEESLQETATLDVAEAVAAAQAVPAEPSGAAPSAAVDQPSLTPISQMEQAERGLIPNFSRKFILDQARSLRERFAEENPGQEVPPLAKFEADATELLEQFGRDMPTVAKGLKGAIPGPRKETPEVSKYQALRESLRAQSRAAAQAARMTKQEIKAAQTELVQVIEKSGMEPGDKAKFLRAVKNTQTQEQLAKLLPEIETRIEGLIERAAKRKMLAAIGAQLKRARVRKQSGKPVGKYTAEVQDVLDAMRGAAALTKAEADARIADNIAKHPDGILPDEVVRENRILDLMGGLEEKGAADLAGILAQIKDTRAEGRALRQLLDAERKERIGAAVKSVVADITGGKGVEEGSGTFGAKDLDKAQPRRAAVRKFFRDLVLGWNDLLDIMANKSGKPPDQSDVSKFGNVFAETLAKKKGIRLANERLRLMVEQSYGVTKEGDVLGILRESTRPVNLGRFTNSAGKAADLVMTRAMARKKWMEMRDPSLAETFEAKEGMAYTPEIRQAIEKFLTPQDKAFAEAQIAFYREYHGTVNEVYREMYGVSLPFNEFYSPIRRMDVDAGTPRGFGEFMQEASARRSATSGSLKSRVRNIKPLEMVEDTSALQRHVEEMEHFKAWAKKVRDLYAVFGNTQVKQAIEQTYGGEFYGSVYNFIEDFARGGAARGNRSQVIDYIRKQFTRSALAVRPSIFVKQLTSQLAFLETMSPADFIAGVADFWANPAAKVRILRESEFFKNRGQTIDRDIKAALQSDAFKAYRKKDTFFNRLMLNVQLGDIGAIAAGGWAVYRRARKQGKSHEAALHEFAEISNRTQQSSDLAEQSKIQRGGSFEKLFTMFMTSPNQYLRRELAAIRQWRTGRISTGEAAKRVTIYHVMLPMLFQFVADFGEFKPKEQARAVLLGSLNGLFILGDTLDYAIRRALGLPTYARGLPVFDLGEDVIRAIESGWAAIIDDIDEDDIAKAINGLLQVTGAATGLPLRQVKDMIAALNDIYEEDYRMGIGGLLGWPKGALKESDDWD
jgi:hypothetical protein